MALTVAARLAVVETKVGAFQTTQDAMALKVDEIYDHIVAEKAQRRQRNQFFAGIVGFFAVCGTLFEIFRK